MTSSHPGKDKFQEGLQGYMKKHAYGNTVTKDLWDAWSSVSGLDVAGAMASWTNQVRSLPVPPSLYHYMTI